MEINIRLTRIGGIAAEVTSIVKIIYYIFVVLFVFSLVVSLTNKSWNFIKPIEMNIFLGFLHFNHAKQMK
jgi:ABC-type phosphate transport system permease subunit